VLVITSFGRNIADAVQVSRDLLAKIDFEGMYYRRDIGYEFEK
jgi:phosphoribosylamine--glycine ligase